MKGFWKGVAGSLTSAILIALMISIWNDGFYRSVRLTGYWKAEFKTINTSYSKYSNLKVNYDYIINQEGNALVGSGEKISEDSGSGVIEYDPKERTHLNLTGAVTYKIFSSNVVDILSKEEGRLRPSSTIIKLTVESPESMVGTFISTVAKSSGIVRFTKVNGS